MQFYFIRHGQSTNNRLYAQAGSRQERSPDPELTEVGQQQAHYVADFLYRDDGVSVEEDAYDPQNVHRFGITHLYTSLMVRAVATGAVIARALGLPLLGWKDLHETGGMFLEDAETGDLIGQPGETRAYFTAHYPDLVLPESVTENGWWNRSFEPYEERPARAQRVLQDLMGRHGGTDHRVAVVSHGGFFNHLLMAILNMPEEGAPWFLINNTAITRVDFNAEGTTVVYVNRADFLPRTLLT
ncbi:MAG TPA: histidine phosphatase family protein [bacterium]|nr:histidine phosphatase family protein [bacterium]